MQWLTLEEWDKQNYAKPHSKGTLRNWAKNGNFHPPAEKHGLCWMVKADAKYICPDRTANRILKQAKAMQSSIALPSELDADVLRILNDGTQAA